MGFELSEEVLIQVGVNQGSALSPLLFAIVVDVTSKNAGEGLMNEILYADDLDLMNENIKNLKEKFLKRKEAIESKELKINFMKTKVMVSGSKGEVLKSKVDPCTKCGKRMMANSVMCTKCGKWVDGRSANMKRVTSTLVKDFIGKVCVNTKEEIVEPGDKYHFLTMLTLCRVFVIWGTG